MPFQAHWYACLALTCIAASDFAAAAPDWDNEQVIQINREPMPAIFWTNTDFPETFMPTTVLFFARRPIILWLTKIIADHA